MLKQIIFEYTNTPVVLHLVCRWYDTHWV